MLREAVVYNPNSLPEEELPYIYGFNNGGSPGFYYGQLVAENGVPMGSHICSDELFMWGDLGILEGHRPDRHEGFKKHYPQGYRMAFVSAEELKTHEGLNAAIERNKRMGELAT